MRTSLKRCFSFYAVFLVAPLLFGFWSTQAKAGSAGKTTEPSLQKIPVEIDIFRKTQLMLVSVNGTLTYLWKVSTGRKLDWTPAGTFQPVWLDRYHRTSIYGGGRMPYSIFFNGNIAIHATLGEVDELGTRSSHGCVHLLLAHARILFALVKKYGWQSTLIIVY